MGTDSSNTSRLLKASREGAAATSASKLFHCLIVLCRKVYWIRVLVLDGEI